jgi:hypothetical protein
MAIQSYRDLEAWKVGMDFAVRIYGVTKVFPRDELYGLTSQLRRAAVTLALGSLAEAETQIELARRVSLLGDQEAASLGEMTATLGRILHGLRRSLAEH